MIVLDRLGRTAKLAERLPDAKRAVYLAVDAMLRADEKRRVLDASVCGAVVEVLLVDD